VGAYGLLALALAMIWVAPLYLPDGNQGSRTPVYTEPPLA